MTFNTKKLLLIFLPTICCLGIILYIISGVDEKETPTPQTVTLPESGSKVAVTSPDGSKDQHTKPAEEPNKTPNQEKEGEYLIKTELFKKAAEHLPVDPHGYEDRHGTPPAGFRLDGDGQLIVDSTLREFFDFYLNLVAEDDSQEISVARLLTLIGELPPDQQEYAKEVLDRYLDSFEKVKKFYSTDFASNFKDDITKKYDQNNPDDVKKVHDLIHEYKLQIRRIQEKALGSDLNDAFYGRDNKSEDLEHQAQLVVINPDTSVEEKILGVFDVFRLEPKASEDDIPNINAHYFNLDQRFISNNSKLSEEEKYALRAKLFSEQFAESLRKN